MYVLYIVIHCSPQVLFNLANQYHANKMYSEALNTYLLIVKNKMFTNGGVCVRVKYICECSTVLSKVPKQ